MRMPSRDPRKTKIIKPAPASPPPSGADAGARPLSQRQRDHLSHLHAAQVGRPEAVLNRAVTGVHRIEPATPFKSGSATRARQKAKHQANRKHVDWGKILLRGATVVLCAELLATFAFSPRLWVQTVSMRGNATVPTERLTKRLALLPRTNLLRTLWERPRLVAALRAEPTVASATIAPVFPNGLAVSVTERVPFAAVQFDSAPGKWYTMDKNRVPFRVFDGAPESGLPLVMVATMPGSAKPTLGKTGDAPGLSEAYTCIAWTAKQGGNFPVQKITVDNAGKLCLNRAGDVTVMLGPGLELREKLQTLSLLLDKRADLRGSASTDVAKINLLAYDAPALVPRPDSLMGDATP
ncbi:MAG: FtsQ-type POTRA domain-containing protein [Armatimonadetes bacterium]|nr:FtsQ-type POTRA domain-containing protein [Armatimonadota bacterium]